MSRVPGTYRGPILAILPSIPDDADETTKNGLAVRNACSIEGRCPACGAEPKFHPDPDYPAVMHMVFRHEDFCPVVRDAA